MHIYHNNNFSSLIVVQVWIPPKKDFIEYTLAKLPPYGQYQVRFLNVHTLTKNTNNANHKFPYSFEITTSGVNLYLTFGSQNS